MQIDIKHYTERTPTVHTDYMEWALAADGGCRMNSDMRIHVGYSAIINSYLVGAVSPVSHKGLLHQGWKQA